MKRGTARERILQAALEVFARKGYHRAIVDEFSTHLASAVAEVIASRHGALTQLLLRSIGAEGTTP